jgi:hypothetical protein
MAVVCNTCGTQYDDFAEYCNECNIPLVDNSGNSRERVATTGANLKALEKSRASAALIHRVVGWFYIVVFLAIVSAFLAIVGNSSIKDVYVFLPVLILPAIHFWVAGALVAGKPWGRALSIFFGILLLFGFPLGTILGVILLMQLFGPEWEAAA